MVRSGTVDVFEFLSAHGEGLYALAFFCGLGGVALWEGLAPRRGLDAPLRARWIGSVTMFLLGNALGRALFPGLAIGAAAFAGARGWGLFNLIDAPFWLVLSTTLLALDLARYGLHRAFHVVPLFWRVHGMHHSDPDYDLTTGLRFHPFETVVLFATSFALITLLGAPVAAVAASEAVLAVSGPFAHGNVRLPAVLDSALRLVLVTPDMHRVHHSLEMRESVSNFSSVFSWWDRLFGTYLAQPGAGHADMRIGLEGFEDPKHLGIGWMLIHPFLPGAGPSASTASAAEGR